jgi:hypothetical protein
MNDNPERTPRTMQEAFGPNANTRIHEHQEPMHKDCKTVLVGSLIISLALIGMALLGWLPGAAA